MKFHIETACFATFCAELLYNALLGTEGAYMLNMQGLSQLKCTSANLSNKGGEQQRNVVTLGQESLQNEGQAEGML